MTLLFLFHSYYLYILNSVLLQTICKYKQKSGLEISRKMILTAMDSPG